MYCIVFFFQAEDGIRDLVRSRGLGDVYKRQALTMAMGFGCNAAGVVATRVIDSPRERLIAIITNNFSLCNGRWPTQILIATIFIGGAAPAYLAGIASAGAVAVSYTHLTLPTSDLV